MRAWIKFIIFALVLMANTKLAGQVRSDEEVVFFPTAAYLSADERQWMLPIHGWIFEPERSRVRKAATAAWLKEQYGLTIDQAAQPYFDQRINLFLGDNERGKRLRIRLADRVFQMPPSAANGHFQTTLAVAVAEVEKITTAATLSFHAVLAENDSRRFQGQVLLVKPRGLSIISDIDDTIKISHVGDKKRLLQQTLLLPFQAVPGMAQRYRIWFEQDRNASLHFVSSSPWQLYSPLAEFTRQAGFPSATFALKQVRFKDASLLNLFKPGLATKPLQIEPLLRRYPQRQFILIGDSGEQDPEIYAGLMRRYPRQISRIYIRNVSPARVDDERFRQVFSGIEPSKWQLFADPNEIIWTR